MGKIEMDVQSLGALLRLRRGRISQRALAQFTGLAPSAIAKYETDDRRPSLGSIMTLARVLRLSDSDWLLVRTLMGGDVPTEPPSPLPDGRERRNG